MARPTKLTPVMREKIIVAVGLGIPFEEAAKQAGISSQTFRNWLKRGESESRGEFHDFVLAVREAEGRALMKWMAIIDRAAQEGNWVAAAWKAERRYPQHYGRHRVEITGKDGAAIEQKVKVEQKAGPPDPEDMIKRIQALIDTGVIPGFQFPAPASDAPDAEQPHPDAG